MMKRIGGGFTALACIGVLALAQSGSALGSGGGRDVADAGDGSSNPGERHVTAEAVQKPRNSAPSHRASSSSTATFETSMQSRLLAMPGNRVAAWDEKGWFWIRQSDGGMASFQLRQLTVRSVTRAGEHLVVVGIDAEKQIQALRVDLQGVEVNRWTLPQDAGFGVEVHPEPLSIRTRKSGYLLREKGLVEELRVPDLHDSCTPPASALASMPRLIQPESAGIACHPADLAMATARKGHCWRPADKGWQIYGQFREVPLICGGALIARDGADQAALVVYDLKTAKKKSRRNFNKRTDTWPEIACVDDQYLLVGTRDLTKFALPSLNPVDTLPGGKAGPNPIVKLVVTEDLIAFRRRGEAGVEVLSRAK